MRSSSPHGGGSSRYSLEAVFLLRFQTKPKKLLCFRKTVFSGKIDAKTLRICAVFTSFTAKMQNVHFHKSHRPKMFIFTSCFGYHSVSHRAVEVRCAFSLGFEPPRKRKRRSCSQIPFGFRIPVEDTNKTKTMSFFTSPRFGLLQL